MTTRMQLLQKHNNNYGFGPTKFQFNMEELSKYKLSIVIPYYNTGHIFSRCIHFLNNAAKHIPEVEIIVVDDGSSLPARDFIPGKIAGLRLVEHTTNLGRTEARNSGVAHANGDIILFLDSDILVEEQLLLNHLALHHEALRHKKKPIVVSFFEFTQKDDSRIESERIQASDLNLNDFRLECTYGTTWVGCDEDKKFIGEHMKIVEETDYFRQWKGQFKAWMLPNMILGGAFSVQKKEINAVGNFDSRFKGYGFTETSAVTRMIAEGDNVVIPSLKGGALHIEDELTNVPRKEKDRIFKKKHDFYFNIFLEEEVNMKKKAVFIDWNKTLSYSLFWEQLKDSSHKLNKHHGDIEKWLFVDNKHHIDPWMRGLISEDDILTQMSDDIGVSKGVIKKELALSCNNMKLCSPKIEKLIRDLQKNNVAVVIATDNMDTFRKYTVPALKLGNIFDAILISSELGVLKDDKEPSGRIPFFDDYLEERGLTYADSVLLDDSPDSSGKFLSLGFSRVMIDSPEKLVNSLEELVASYE